MKNDYFEFCNSVKIMCGRFALENMPHELENLGVKKPLVLTNDFLVKIGLVKTALTPLEQAGMTGYPIYDQIPADSSVNVVNDAAKVFREQECDGMIAIGGGSVLDTAKGVGMVISQNSQDLLAFMGSEMLTRGQRVPYFAIPTTAGTGSESTLVAVIANQEQHVKMEFISYNLLPDVAVIDPRMTASLPPKMTAATGMDALSHAIEAYTCIQRNPLSSAYATAAIEMIGQNLKRVVEDGKDEEARLNMALASTMAGAAFSNSMVGLVHAIGHACGGIAHVAHGEAMSILLPYCMAYNMDTIGYLYGKLLLPLAGEQVYLETPKEERGMKFLMTVRDMAKEFHEMCGLPITLSQAGVREDQLTPISHGALNDGAILYNPKEIHEDEVLALLQQAF